VGKYYDQCVCLSVCPLVYVKNTCPNFTKFCLIDWLIDCYLRQWLGPLTVVKYVMYELMNFLPYAPPPSQFMLSDPNIFDAPPPILLNRTPLKVMDLTTVDHQPPSYRSRFCPLLSTSSCWCASSLSSPASCQSSVSSLSAAAPDARTRCAAPGTWWRPTRGRTRGRRSSSFGLTTMSTPKPTKKIVTCVPLTPPLCGCCR